MSSTGGKPARPAKPAKGTKAGTKPAQVEPTAAEAEADSPDMRAKFREALDRKQHQHTAGNADGEGKESKVHQAHGPVGGKRTFRRKSG
jgi:uncharacterized protein DUF5302